ncbi:MAG: DUF2325 domain-containing protein [Clostridiales bacterium]|jgi:uncharacterized protein YjaG (DUF416 family)|nr:DUF2325 domain-containing protein [Clostridiales bacterium]
MCVVIIGGNERMEYKYKSICKEFNCDAKVFTKLKNNLYEFIGTPDLIVLFTHPVSHTMAITARNKASQKNISLVQSHCGSCEALRNILRSRFEGRSQNA